MSTPAKFPALFVLGVAHCGSTLVGRMLDCHPRLACFGELMRLDLALKGGLPCSCGAPLDECAHWKARLELLEPERGHDPERFTLAHYERLAALEGADTAVDLSKTLAWRLGRRFRKRGAGYLVLVRDSRGVLAAAQRAGRPAEQRVDRHVKWMKRFARFAKRQGAHALVVHYEDLCLDPRRELARIAAFLGVEFDEAMLRPADQVHHLVHTSASPYLKGSNELRVDERWRSELAPAVVKKIERGMAKVALLRERYLAERVPS